MLAAAAAAAAVGCVTAGARVLAVKMNVVLRRLMEWPKLSISLPSSTACDSSVTAPNEQQCQGWCTAHQRSQHQWRTTSARGAN
jgi:hypothetical protein